jgi:hypothetical protein
MSHPESPKARSEKLIPLVRKCARNPDCRRRTGTKHTQLSLANREWRAVNRATGHVLFWRHDSLHAGGAHGECIRQTVHPAHLSHWPRLCLYDALRLCDSELWTVSRVQGFNNEPPYHCETLSLPSDSNGVIEVPSGPGFGVDVDPDFVKQAKAVTG